MELAWLKARASPPTLALKQLQSMTTTSCLCSINHDTGSCLCSVTRLSRLDCFASSLCLLLLLHITAQHISSLSCPAADGKQ